MTTPNNPRRDQAFLLYQSLGPKRTFKAVATQLGVSERTVRSWAKQNDWRRKATEREIAEARRLADQTITETTAHQDRNLKIVRVALMKVAKAIAEGRVRIQMGDLDRLVRLEGYITEQRGDNVRPDLQSLTDEQLMERMRTLHRKIGEDLAEHDAEQAASQQGLRELTPDD